MVKREISDVGESSAKRRKVDGVGGGPNTLEQIESARQLQQHLTFQQDSVPQLRKGMCAKDWYERVETDDSRSEIV